MLFFFRWKLSLETSANFVATRAGKRRWNPSRVSGNCVMGIRSVFSFLARNDTRTDKNNCICSSCFAIHSFHESIL